MKLAIMQPYFLPYIGYWQLMNTVDTFVVYDNIQYTKKGWINRNRFLQNGKPAYFTLPLKKDSDYLNVVDRRIADDFNPEKIYNQLNAAYKKAPFFSDTMAIVDDAINCKKTGLFDFVINSIFVIRKHLDITSEMIISSAIDIDHSLRGKYKVMEICRALGADNYINPIGGMELYNADEFQKKGIKLSFLKPRLTPYEQNCLPFVEGLSVIDGLMFKGREWTIKQLKDFELMSPQS